MDKFYSIVVIVAFVVLVIALIGLGVMLQKQDDATVFPPVQNQCPDGWTPDTNDICTISKTVVEQKNLGTFDPASVTGFDVKYLIKTDGTTSYTTANAVDSDNSDYKVKFNSAALPCDKKKWANAILLFLPNVEHLPCIKSIY